MYENELYHHGIPGMKWGVRRYQNPDGTLTAAGKKRKVKQDASDERYRQKQVKATERYHNRSKHSGLYGIHREKGINALQKEVEKSEAKYRKTGETKYMNKAELAKNEIVGREYLKNLEIAKVKNLTHDQIQKERVAVGKSVVRDTLINLGVNAVTVPMAGIIYAQGTSPQSVRSATRFNESDD